jgi:hypothetical protein
MAYTLVTPYQWQTYGAGYAEFTVSTHALQVAGLNGGTIDGPIRNSALQM